MRVPQEDSPDLEGKPEVNDEAGRGVSHAVPVVGEPPVDPHVAAAVGEGAVGAEVAPTDLRDDPGRRPALVVGWSDNVFN